MATLDRIFTWGLDDDAEHEARAEARAYYEAMAAEVGPARTTLAAVRSTPSWLWNRLSSQRVTTLPAAAGLAALALGSSYVVALPGAFAFHIRMLFAINSIGLLLAALALVRRPQRIVIRTFGLPSLLIAIAVIGIALGTRGDDAWSAFPMPPVGSVADSLFRVGLGVIGLGCLVATINAYVTNNLRLALAALGLATAGFALFGSAIIVWAVQDAPDQWGFASAAAMTGI